ncbi:hypothetical protein FQA39_LY19088 [Lamprigera yunnana]|nr:hypothetical protein FQA39_LY19088 [Lamprigera yunnana]
MSICTSIISAESRMKVFILVLFAISLQYNSAASIENFGEIIRNDEEYLRSVSNICMATSNASPPLVQNLVYLGYFPNNKELKEFVQCVALRLGVIDENGNLDKDKTMSYIGTDNSSINDVVYELCASLTADTELDKIWVVGNCIYDTVKLFSNL